MSLRRMYPMGQLPEKYQHQRVREIPMTKKDAKRIHDVGSVLTYKRHERNISMLQTFVHTLIKPGEATPFQVATLRAAMAAHGRCPDCGGHVHIDTEAEVIVQNGDERETSRRQAACAFCSSCEFSMEMPEVQR